MTASFSDAINKFPDAINRQGYEKKHIVSYYYTQSRLQIPEVLILVKYKESIWEKQILDIGCGGGRTALYLKNFSTSYIGIDYSGKMVKFCQKRFPNNRFIHCDIRDMGIFGDNAFDFVLFSFNGLDAVRHEGRLKGLREIQRVLRKDGVFVFSSHNKNFKDAVSSPKITFNPNPCEQVKAIKNFIISTCNHLKNKKYQYLAKEYAIINDRAHKYAFLSYYIEKKSQIAQLDEAGFRTVEMYDTCGNTLDLDSDDSNSGWIYYVARKK